MQPGSIKALTPSEIEEAFEHAPHKTARVAEWRDSHGLEHRDVDLPATIWSTGTQEWFHHGLWHRDNGLPAVIQNSGTMLWYEHGERTGDQDKPPQNAPEIFFNRLPGQKTKSASKRQ